MAIHEGVERGVVEKNWVEDGGFNFRENTRYSYRACDRIKIDVEFDPYPKAAAPDVKNGYVFPKTDKVKKVSRPYLEYPVRD